MLNRTITSLQLSKLIFITMIGSSIVYIPAQDARQDAWISSICGCIFGFYIIYALLKVQAIYPNQSISKICRHLYGSIIGTILNALFFISIFCILITDIIDITYLVLLIYPKLNLLAIDLLIVSICGFILIIGIVPFAYLGEVIISTVILLLAFALTIVVPLADFSNLSPVFHDWRSIVGSTLLIANWPYDEVVIIAFFLFMVNDLNKKSSSLYYWFALSAAFLALLSLLTVSVLGPNTLLSESFPVHKIYQLVGLGAFDRFDIFFFVLWFLTAVITSTLYLHGSVSLFQDIFRGRNYRSLIIPFGLMLVFLSNYLAPDEFVYKLWSYHQLPYYTFPVNLLYPTALLLAVKLKKVSTDK